MKTFLIIVMLLAWIILATSILLMSPKWWLWFGIGWASWNNEYWSKKSIEWKLKWIAIVTWIIFVWTILFIPYM